jgi:hypothetical protein
VLLKPRDIVPEGTGFAQQKNMVRNTLDPWLTLPPYWNRTIVSPFLTMKMKEVKICRILSHSSDSECATDLQEVLKMSISILRGLAAEWALLHHVDES